MQSGLQRLLVAIAAGMLMVDVAFAGALRYCSGNHPLTAAQQDKVLQFAAIAKAELEASGSPLAIVSRSGLDLSYFNQRYSHAGVSLQKGQNTPWSVRQLYFDCAEKKPRIFDQGLAGFAMGSDDPEKGFISLIFLPKPQAEALEQTSKDNALSLQLLANQYSANAYPFSIQYQNCNQWLAELLATSWGTLPDGKGLRARSQAWLASQDYSPTEFDLRWRPLLWLTAFSELVHTDDHPAPDVDKLRLQVSMPASIEAFVKTQAPESYKVEMCRTTNHIVIRRGWDAIADDCAPAPGDQVITFD